MEVAVFVKLPAAKAGEMYQQRLQAGDMASASLLHQAYYEVHRIRPSDGQQISDAMSQSTQPNIAAPAILMQERSAIRRTGAIIWIIGLVIVLLAGAPGGGFGGIAFAGALASVGFTLWLAGILEDRLIEVISAIKGQAIDS